jgi:hypothetical protein
VNNAEIGQARFDASGEGDPGIRYAALASVTRLGQFPANANEVTI